jgi:hypothetical protein
MKILQKIESWLGNSTWIITKLEQIKNAIIKFLNKWEAVMLEKHAESSISKMDLPEQDANILRTIAKNHINYHTATKVSNNRSIVKPKLLLNITLQSTKIVVETLGKIVGIQPMAGPVAQIFSMQYVTEDQKPLSENTSDIFNADNPKKIALSIVANAVEARSKKLKAGLSIEAISDSMLLHTPNSMEDIIVSLISYEIADEIVSEVLDKLFAEGEAKEVSFQNKDNIIPLINMNATEVARQTRRGSANWMVISPYLLQVIETVFGKDFVPCEKVNYSSLTLVGTIFGKLKVYTHLWTASDRILMGYKGAAHFDSSYTYSPYMPVVASELHAHPITFVPQINIASRAGEQLLDPKAYRALTVTGLTEEPVADTKN